MGAALPDRIGFRRRPRDPGADGGVGHPAESARTRAQGCADVERDILEEAVRSRLARTARGDGSNVVNGLRVLERREIAGRVAKVRRTNHAAHDLGVARLRQIANELDRLRAGAACQVASTTSAFSRVVQLG